MRSPVTRALLLVIRQGIYMDCLRLSAAWFHFRRMVVHWRGHEMTPGGRSFRNYHRHSAVMWLRLIGHPTATGRWSRVSS